jgi:hypothetical protein
MFGCVVDLGAAATTNTIPKLPTIDRHLIFHDGMTTYLRYAQKRSVAPSTPTEAPGKRLDSTL